MGRSRLQEEIEVHRTIAPDAHTVGTINGDSVDTKGFRTALVFLDVGTVGTSVDFDVEESEDDGVADAFTVIAGSAITQITVTEKQVIIAINVEQTERHIRGVLAAGGTEDAAACIILAHPEQSPPKVTQYDEVVNVH